MEVGEDTGTLAVASFIVTVQVEVVAAGWLGSPSPGTTGPLTVTLTSNALVPTSTGRPSTWSAGFASVPTNGCVDIGVQRVFFGKEGRVVGHPRV